ncbi:Chitin synthase, class 5 [Gonapodya sp. JEL0774]|nr:Chitin synthase, class 5 [Gonapodya sp. JEL0774]
MTLWQVGKLDAGMGELHHHTIKALPFADRLCSMVAIAILLSPDHHLIEFPATILPGNVHQLGPLRVCQISVRDYCHATDVNLLADGVSTGSIVNVSISRDIEKETRMRRDFLDLQEDIYHAFRRKPEHPTIKVKWVTQTSITITWDPLVLYNVELRGIDVYRNNIRSPGHFYGPTTVKLSGCEVNTEYEIFIGVRTSGGSLTSNKLMVRTHTLDNLTGIRIAFGEFGIPEEVQQLKEVCRRNECTWSDDLTVENTHFVCTLPRGEKYQRALELNIPIVNGDWIRQCEATRKIQPVGIYHVAAREVNIGFS